MLPKGFRKAVTFSYDDGNFSDIHMIELFNKYGVKCTANLNSGKLSEADRWMFLDKFEVRHLNFCDVRDLYQGHEIAVHTLTHPHLENLDEKTIANEICMDKKILEDWFEKPVVGMAYPFGTFDDRVVNIAKAQGIRWARTVEESHSFDRQMDLMRFNPTCHHRYPKLFEMIERFVDSQGLEDQVFCIWGHSYEFAGYDGWKLLEDILKCLSGHKDVFYGTNSEVLL